MTENTLTSVHQLYLASFSIRLAQLPKTLVGLKFDGRDAFAPGFEHESEPTILKKKKLFMLKENNAPN